MDYNWDEWYNNPLHASKSLAYATKSSLWATKLCLILAYG